MLDEEERQKNMLDAVEAQERHVRDANELLLKNLDYEATKLLRWL